MSPDPLVSIMLPAQRADHTLHEAARSCLDQCWPNLELLLIQNDSTPQTVQVMKNLAAYDERVRILTSPPGAGFISALNLGWRAARGDFLARMDADDRSHPSRIRSQVTHLSKHPELAAVGSRVRILRRTTEGSLESPKQGYADFEKWLNSVIFPEEIAAERFVDSPIANPCAMIRREAMVALSGYREVSWAEDYDFWLRMLEGGLKIGKVDEVLLDWIDSETRLTRNDAHYSQDQFLCAKAHFLARLSQVQERGAVVCGAGPIGKRLARLLQCEGVDVRAFLEVNERQIGQKIAQVPVLDSERALPLPGKPVMVGAVGLSGAREKIRKLLLKHGYEEGVDFFAAA